jgi:serine/threonine protein phosphatase PrpC
LTASPETTHYSIVDQTGFLVLASDGIFDPLSNADVVDHVGAFLDKPDSFPDTNAATHLIRMALTDGKGPQHISRLLTISPDAVRRYRDDMTVQIVFFDNVKSQLQPMTTKTMERCSNIL